MGVLFFSFLFRKNSYASSFSDIDAHITNQSILAPKKKHVHIVKSIDNTDSILSSHSTLLLLDLSFQRSDLYGRMID